MGEGRSCRKPPNKTWSAATPSGDRNLGGNPLNYRKSMRNKPAAQVTPTPFLDLKLTIYSDQKSGKSVHRNKKTRERKRTPSVNTSQGGIALEDRPIPAFAASSDDESNRNTRLNAETRKHNP